MKRYERLQRGLYVVLWAGQALGTVERLQPDLWVATRADGTDEVLRSRKHASEWLISMEGVPA